MDRGFAVGSRVRSGVALRLGFRADGTWHSLTLDSAEEARCRRLLPVCPKPDVPWFRHRVDRALDVFGQANPAAIVVAFVVVVGVAVFVVFYEEPTLRRKFGAEYEVYCRNVPRWIPRLDPWSPQVPGN
jgi:hypothetical protein